MLDSRFAVMQDWLHDTLLPLPGVRVVDGQFLEGDLTAADVLAVGWAPTGEPAITVQQQSSTLNRRRAEQVTIRCFLSSLRGTAGSRGARSARDRVQEVLLAVAAAVSIPTDLATRVELGMDGEVMQDQTPSGSMCSALFSVRFEVA